MQDQDQQLPIFYPFTKQDIDHRENNSNNKSLFDQLIYPEQGPFDIQSPLILFQEEHQEPARVLPECKNEEQTPIMNYLVDSPAYQVKQQMTPEVKIQATMKEQKPCQCSKIQCEKKNCWCFRNRKSCRANCKCRNCKNLTVLKRKVKKGTMTPFWSISELEEA